MVYKGEIKVHGNCRGENSAAAVVVYNRNHVKTIVFPLKASSPPTTKLRAEIIAIGLALEQVILRHRQSRTGPLLEITIETSSKNALDCLTVQSPKWERNGWMNVKGTKVANQDVLQMALDWEREVRKRGTLVYGWVPIAENQDAEKAVKEELDMMGEEGGSRDVL